MKNESITNSPHHIASNENANIGGSQSNLFEYIFSSAFGLMKWFVGLRWYVILFIVVIGSYVFFQIEYAIESRRRSKELKREDMSKKKEPDVYKKEGMEIKGILRQNSGEHVKKQVSFYDEEQTTTSSKNSITGVISRIYNLWILPNVYVLFRNIGIR